MFINETVILVYGMQQNMVVIIFPLVHRQCTCTLHLALQFLHIYKQYFLFVELLL